MEDLYNSDIHCMDFSNEEILKYLVEPLKKYLQFYIRLLCKEDEEISENSEKKITHIILDGDTEDFSLAFYGYETNIFIISEKFMFIDDIAKKDFPGCAIYANILYEGHLRDKSHKELLELFYRILVLLKDTKKIEFKEWSAWNIEESQGRVEYNVNVFNDSGVGKTIRLENILFVINKDADVIEYCGKSIKMR
jgi:hypothetical protein